MHATDDMGPIKDASIKDASIMDASIMDAAITAAIGLLDMPAHIVELVWRASAVDGRDDMVAAAIEYDRAYGVAYGADSHAMRCASKQLNDQILRAATGMRCIDCSFNGPTALPAVLPHNLASLCLTGADPALTDDLSRLATCSRTLTSLDVSGTSLSDLGQVARLLPNLRHLNASGCRLKNDLGALLRLTGLESLDLGGYMEGFSAAPLAALTRLTRLDLTSTEFGDPLAEHLSGLVRLQELVLEDARGELDVAPLAALTAMRTLSLHYTRVTCIAALRGMSGLRSLDLGCTDVADLAALTALTCLTDLSLVGDEEWAGDLADLAGLPGLVKLRVDATAVTELAPLSRMTALAELHLGDTAIERAQLVHLYGLTALHTLGLCRCTYMATAPDFGALYGMTALRHLHLGCASAQAVAALARAMPDLEIE